jgi:pSer/pThr/pTyr-binding forkhead associated (FHA) protein
MISNNSLEICYILHYLFDSKNGLFVNDCKIDTCILHNGDIIIFGGGPDLKIGSILSQPSSEFRYTFMEQQEVKSFVSFMYSLY